MHHCRRRCRWRRCHHCRHCRHRLHCPAIAPNDNWDEFWWRWSVTLWIEIYSDRCTITTTIIIIITMTIIVIIINKNIAENNPFEKEIYSTMHIHNPTIDIDWRWTEVWLTQPTVSIHFRNAIKTNLKCFGDAKRSYLVGFGIVTFSNSTYPPALFASASIRITSATLTKREPSQDYISIHLQ